MNVVIHPEPEDQAGGQQDREQSFQGEREAACKMMPTGEQREREGQKEREKNRYAAESRQGTAVQVALQRGRRDPTACSRQIAHVPGENKRQQQRSCKCREVRKGQLTPLS